MLFLSQQQQQYDDAKVKVKSVWSGEPTMQDLVEGIWHRLAEESQSFICLFISWFSYLFISLLACLLFVRQLWIFVLRNIWQQIVFLDWICGDWWISWYIKCNRSILNVDGDGRRNLARWMKNKPLLHHYSVTLCIESPVLFILLNVISLLILILSYFFYFL